MATNPVKKHLIYSNRDFYLEYRRKARKNKKYPARDYKKYKEYIFDVFSEIFRLTIETPWHFVLPYSLGEFYLKKSRNTTGTKVYSVALTKKYNKPTFYFNDHTLRQTFRYTWEKGKLTETLKYYKFNLAGYSDHARKYKMGREALANHLFSIGSDPNKKVPTPYNSKVVYPQEPKYETKQ